MKMQKASEVSGPIQTRVVGDKAVILEGLHVSDRWTVSSLEVLQELP